MKKLSKLIALCLCFSMVLSLAACSKKAKEETPEATQGAEATVTPAGEAEATPTEAASAVTPDYPADRRDASVARSTTNDTTPLVVSTLTMDGKFSPFFYTSGNDGTIVDYTQLQLITNNEKAEPVAGVEYPTAAWNFEMNVSDDQSSSTYKFWLKNGVQYSDGHVMDMNDVLFTLYTYLDPLYDGSSTLYSMDIQGLKAYQTQILDESAADAKTAEFAAAGKEKADAALAGTGDASILDAAWGYVRESIKADSDTLIKSKYVPSDLGMEGPEDFLTTNAQSIILFYTAATLGKEVIAYKDGAYTFDASTGLSADKMAGYTADDYIDASLAVIKANISVADYDAQFGFSTVESTYDYATLQEKAAYLSANQGTVKSISGIVAGKEVCSDGVERETLTVTINGVDPKAIWNFGIPVVPLHYYAGQERHDKANGVDYFGVDYSSPEFINELKDKNGVPMGAGPYKITDANNNENPGKDDFFKDGIVYMTANDYYVMSAPNIKYLRFKTVNSGSELDAVLTGEVHFSDPQASADRINMITSDSSYSHLNYILVDNLGYGYIGICASIIPDLNERRALMSAMDTSLTLNSYPGGLAACIYRGMSQVSWAYPEGCEAMFPFDETGAASKEYFLKAGFTEQADGTLLKADGTKASYKFTLPADASSHPAGQVFLKAQEILEKLGVEVIIEVDDGVLNKLDQGIIAVWAAAWQATIDPDMFQVYYSDPAKNQAGSPTSFGLYYLFENGTDEEKQILTDLNTLIEKGRTSLNVDERKPIYSEALDKAMEIAVELPTYQRKNMYVYNKTVIDPESLTPADQITPYRSPIQFIWNVSLLDQK